MNTSRPSTHTIILSLSVFLVSIAAFFPIHLVGGEGVQWDFYSYYYAAKWRSLGQNPYNFDAVKSLTDHKILPYVYHPFTLPFFEFFTLFEVDYAFSIYVLASVFLLGVAYFLLIVSGLLLPQYALLAAATLLFGFGNSYSRALASGNPALFEVSVAWIAMSAFAMNKRALYYSSIIIWGFFKGTPFVFLLLPLVRKNGFKEIRLFSLITFATIAAFFLPELVEPEIFANFLSAARGVNELGRINPSSLALAQSIAREFDSPTASSLALPFYLLWVVLVIGAGSLLMKRHSQTILAREQILLAVLIHALIAPRFKDYAYIQLTVVAVSALLRTPGLAVFIFFDQLGLAQLIWPEGLPEGSSIRIAFDYLPFLCVILIAMAVASDLFKRTSLARLPNSPAPVTQTDPPPISGSSVRIVNMRFDPCAFSGLTLLVAAYLFAACLHAK